MTQEVNPLYSPQTRVTKRGRRDSPLQTGTHFPLLKNREWSSLVKQISDAAGVLKMTHKSLQMSRTIKPHRRKKRKIIKNHQRILLRSHRCLSFRTPAEKRAVKVPRLLMSRGLRAVSPQMCGSYPRCVGHPYRTGDWTE